MTSVPGQSDAQLAIIDKPKFGVGDRGGVALSFSVYITESSAALQIFGGEEAAEILKAYGVDDVAKLQGRPCWVRVSSSMIQWDRPWTKR